MFKLKLAKILFCMAALLFVAKPFLGFTLFNRSHPPAIENIFVKAFSKRHLEKNEDSKFSMGAIQKQLAGPAKQFVLRFTFLLAIILPAIFAAGISLTNRFLNDIQLKLSPRRHVYLLNRKLII